MNEGVIRNILHHGEMCARSTIFMCHETRLDVLKVKKYFLESWVCAKESPEITENFAVKIAVTVN